MDKELKAKWVKALRSGEYAQGTGQLRDGDSYCCLGVLCEIAKVRFLSSGEYLPASLANAAGVDLMVQEELAFMNDNGRTFRGIAQWIERKL